MTISRNNIIYFHLVKSHTMLINQARFTLIRHAAYLPYEKLIHINFKSKFNTPLICNDVIFYFYKSLIEADNSVQ